jgi:hypothetical protein
MAPIPRRSKLDDRWGEGVISLIPLFARACKICVSMVLSIVILIRLTPDEPSNVLEDTLRHLHLLPSTDSGSHG